MIEIRNRSECCGCTACVTVCPVQCIVLRRDMEEGFDYPVANPDLCINCGKCEKVCPVLNPLEEKMPLDSFAARDRNSLGSSSSGGVFPRLAEDVITKGGVVYGAVFDADFTVGHSSAESLEGIVAFRGSKYVQSELYSSFDDIRNELEAGREVLFSGTPCQVAGLNKSLGKKYDSLLTVDCACHGVPGPGLWSLYLKSLKHRYGEIVHLAFRDKKRSWYHYDFNINGKLIPFMKDPYMALFVQNMTLRPSCYKCPVRKGRSGSDITLADLWNAAVVVPEMNDDKGVSLVCVNTEKGADAFAALDGRLDVKKVDPELAMDNNGGFAEHVPVPAEREKFFKGIRSAEDVYRYMSSFVVRQPLPSRLLKATRQLIQKIKGNILK